MSIAVSREPRDVLDQAIRSKALAAEFFEYLARSVPGVKLRQAFQGFARDEREQRKILMKYRRDLYGAPGSDAWKSPESPADLVDREITARADLVVALGSVIRSEERATRFYTEAALNFSDRHAKIFFRILSESGRARSDQLRTLLVAVERDGLQHGTVAPLELQPTA